MTDLPYCTKCGAPRIAVFELGDGTTRCTMCIEEAIEQTDQAVLAEHIIDGPNGPVHLRITFDPKKFGEAWDEVVKRREQRP